MASPGRPRPQTSSSAQGGINLSRRTAAPSFTGFPRNVRSTPVPDPLFGPLLEEIGDLAELKVTLRAIWLWHQKRGAPRLLSRGELCNDLTLRRGLGVADESPATEIERGLALAVSRGVFLACRPDPAAPGRQFYLLNTEAERRALDRLQGEGPLPPADVLTRQQDEGLFDAPAADKADIFVLYEQNIGTTIGPLLAEQLKDAEEDYPWPWIVEAFRIAVAGNRFSWRYIEGILRRWASEGRNHGEPGRHSEEGDRTKYLDEYQRRRGHLPWERPGR